MSDHAVSSSLPSDNIFPWKRFFARALDMLIYSVICSVVWDVAFARFNVPSLSTLSGLWLLLYFNVCIVFSIFIETFLLATLGSTIAKSLFSIKLKTKTGQKLSFITAIRRTVRVCSSGQFFYIPLLSWLAAVLSYRKLKKEGITTWDQKCQTVITHKKLSKLRIVGIIILWMIIVSGYGLVRSPAEPVLTEKARDFAWKSYPNTKEGFTVKFPTAPKYKVKIARDLNSDYLSTYTSSTNVPEKAIYILDVVRDQNLNKHFRDKRVMADLFIPLGTHYKVVSSKYVMIDQYEAFDSLYENDNQLMKIRVILAGKTMYAMSVQHSDSDESAANFFINSFKVQTS